MGYESNSIEKKHKNEKSGRPASYFGGSWV